MCMSVRVLIIVLPTKLACTCTLTSHSCPVVSASLLPRLFVTRLQWARTRTGYTSARVCACAYALENGSLRKSVSNANGQRAFLINLLAGRKEGRDDGQTAAAQTHIPNMSE